MSVEPAAGPPVLVLAPLAGDAGAIACEVEACGLPVRVCGDSAELERRLENGGAEGTLFVVATQESAGEDVGAVLQRSFDREPGWARLPAVFLVSDARRPPPACRMLDRKEYAPSPLVLERPAKPAVLRRIFETQAEARRRQFETRDLLDQLRRSEERRGFLLSELRHRTRNGLAVLHALFSLSARRAESIEELCASFGPRLTNLAEAQAALSAEENATLSLEALIRHQVAPYCASPEQLRTGGPPLRLRERLAFDLSLIVHELATNAAKYGALSTPDGVVEVRWGRLPGERDVELLWRERDGPPVEAPQHSGLGTTLIRGFPSGGASADVRFEPEGLAWRAVIEHDGLLQESTEGQSPPQEP